MIETLTTDQLAAIREKVAGFVFLVELDLSPTIRLASAARDVKWGGETWLGFGRISTVDVIPEKTSLEAAAVRLSLTGVPLSFRSLALQTPIRGKRCNVYVGLAGSDEQPVGDMLLEYSGLMDAPQINTSAPDSKGERTATISITVEGILADFNRGGRARRHTHEDQREQHPADAFYQHADAISKLMREGVPWGVPR